MKQDNTEGGNPPKEIQGVYVFLFQFMLVMECNDRQVNTIKGRTPFVII